MTAAEAQLKERIEALESRLVQQEAQLSALQGKLERLSSALLEEHTRRQDLADRVLALERAR